MYNHPLTKPQNSGLVLEKVCEYFYYNEKHKNSKDVPDIDVPAELCLELLMAADYLNGELDAFVSPLSSRSLLHPHVLGTKLMASYCPLQCLVVGWKC